MKILVTGANGFVGTQLIEYATRSGHLVVAGVRKTSNSRHLNAFTPNLQILSYHDETLLTQELSAIKKEFGCFQLVIHNAALTKASRASELLEANHHLPVRFARSIQLSGLLAEEGKFVFVSSLAARGPDVILQPVTTYGKSKLLAEQELLGLNLPVVIIRPTAIYGPGDGEFLKLYKVIRLGIAPMLASPSQKLSFIYVKDLARLLVDLAPNLPANKIVTVTDGMLYSPGFFYKEIGKSIGKSPFTIPIPAILTNVYAQFNSALSKLIRHNPMLTPEKMQELVSDWSPCEMDNPPEGFYFTPLEDGLAETARYYKENGLL